MPAAAFAALRSSSFRTYLTGYAAASTGTWMRSVAQDWLVLELTGSPAAVGVTMACQFLPVLLFGIPAGQLADRFNRKYLLIIAQSVGVFTSLGLAALSYWQAPVGLIYPYLFLTGVGRAFSVPARWSLVPQVVPPALLANAVTWNSSGWQLASRCCST